MCPKHTWKIPSLRIPDVKSISALDDPTTTLLHAKILKQKNILRKLYTEWYQSFRNSISGNVEQMLLVELGSGGGFIKEIMPNVVTSDVISSPYIDTRFSALNIPFQNNTVDAFFLIDVFHHINDARAFLKEANRCLKIGGKIIMIEPANTLWGRFVYRHFHHEPFDPDGDWVFKRSGPLSSANGALPWIVFCRDRKIFERDFPSLRIARLVPHTPLLYLFSGGFAFRQLMPSFSYEWIKTFERLTSAFHKYLGMFLTVEINKIS